MMRLCNRIFDSPVLGHRRQYRRSRDLQRWVPPRESDAARHEARRRCVHTRVVVVQRGKASPEWELRVRLNMKRKQTGQLASILSSRWTGIQRCSSQVGGRGVQCESPHGECLGVEK